MNASEPLASVLRSGRESFNAQFAAARRVFPGLDADQFRSFLVAVVDPLAVAVHVVRPDRVAEVVMSAYQLGLELAGKGLIGPSRKSDIIGDGWRALASAASPLLASSPDRALSAVANALHQLANTPGARPDQWIRDLARVAPRCADLEILLAAGQVLAWRAGLAHFRASALGVADSLPADLALLAVGATGEWPAIRKRFEEDPWFVPERPTPVAREVGAFRGLGGNFAAPPLVALHDGRLVVSSGEEAWLLTADAFGATLHRATPEERAAPPQTALPDGVHLRGETVGFRERSLPFSIHGELTSAAWNRSTLAVTSSLTHAVLLMPLGTLS